MTPLSESQVKMAWSTVCANRGTVIVAKNNALLMRFVSKFVPLIGMSSTKFLSEFATTIGKRIYIPFTPGTASPQWPLVEQCILLAHEHTHVRQWRANPVAYTTKYLASPAYRGRVEAEAYAVGAEVLGHFCKLGYATIVNDYAARITSLIASSYKCPVPVSASQDIEGALTQLRSEDARLVVDSLDL